MNRTVPARLHVLLARDAATALVIRRGPSRHTAVIGWDRNSDRFQLGQWLHGRIYERRCDLSPDGRHWIYFAMNGRWSSPAKGAWSAIARAPYLKALALFAKGDCWHGGGLFLSSREYWLNDGYGHEVLHDDTRLGRSTTFSWHEGYGGECPSVYYIRLQRDGWTLRSAGPDGSGGRLTVFDKRVNADWQLRKKAHATVHHPVGRGCYFDEHELVDSRSGATLPCPGWEWAEVDGHRLVWAESGKLFAGRLGPQGWRDTTELQDFNALRFEGLEAPY